MRSDNPARGFSFLLADTPDPETVEPAGGGAAESSGSALDLDLSDVATATGKDAEPPEGGYRKRMPTLLDSAPPPPIESPVATQKRPQGAPPLDPLEEQPAEPRDMEGAPIVHPRTAGDPRTTSSTRATRSLLGQLGRPPIPGPGENSGPTRNPPVAGHRARFADSALVPAVKKIRFPTERKPKATAVGRTAQAGHAREQETAPKVSPTPRTRFAEGGFRSGTDFSGRIEVGGAALGRTAPPAQELAPDWAPAPDFAPPEDLPNETTPAEAGWGTDTPTAAELWAQARGGLAQAGHLAKAAGEKSWRRGKSAARLMSSALRARLEQAARPECVPPNVLDLGAGHGAEAAAPNAKPAGPLPFAGASEQAAAEGVSAALPAHRTAASRPLPVALLARGAKSLAAPLAACAAAAIVYQAGSHFLGSASAIALNKGAPAVPELGEIEPAPGATTDSPRSSQATPTPSGGPPPMQVESTDMPQGLSWPGKGLIEVVTAEDELIYVDGVFTGRGPLRRIPVTPGEHDVRIKQNGSERTGMVSVQLDRCTRAVFAQPQ